ncbi:MAG TPA: hypothetical protein VGA73_10450 [Candidatus Binatia bacterium]
MTPHAGMRATNQVFSLFEPDALLPIQYLDTLHRRTPLEPEKRLMWAVLQSAIDCYQSHFSGSGAGPDESFSEVEEWIQASDQHWLFSFANICETLGFHPQYLRGGLFTWKEKQLARRNGDGAPKRRRIAARLGFRRLRAVPASGVLSPAKRRASR